VNAKLRPSQFVVELVESGLAKISKGACANVAWQFPASLPTSFLDITTGRPGTRSTQNHLLRSQALIPEPLVQKYLAVKNQCVSIAADRSSTMLSAIYVAFKRFDSLS
jgi:hypothetical protein